MILAFFRTKPRTIRLMLGFFVFVVGQVEAYTVNDDYRVRDGLANIRLSLQHEDTIRVAYFGGSITAQKGWRVYSQEWLRTEYPKSEIVEINATIGGCGSDFGVFRIGEHVLQANPDLVFVEFAVNDGGMEPATIIKSMEGIVRQIWTADATTDICFVYTIAMDFMSTYRAGSLPQSVATMESVAAHYGIPSINFGPEVVRQVDDGVLLFKGKLVDGGNMPVFSPDGVHPYPETGHRVYESVFISSFSKIMEANPDGGKPHVLGTPLDERYYGHTRMVEWDELEGVARWNGIDVSADSRFSGFAKYFRTIGNAVPGDSIVISFIGDAFGFYDLKTTDSGVITVAIDGAPADTIPRFDKYTMYRRISYKLITGLEYKRHRVVLRVLDVELDKGAILSESGNSMHAPQEFEGKNWYLAKILVNGTLFPQPVNSFGR